METKALAVMPQHSQRSQLIEPTNLNELQQLGKLMSESGFFADSKQAAQACVKILAGREMGFPPIASMVGISIIEGKPAAGSNLLAAAMKNAGYSWRIAQLDTKGCKLMLSYRGQEIGPCEFTEDDAKRANLLGKQNWNKYPKSMYFARTISNAVRTYAPEVLSGLPAYTAEELGADNTNEDGSVVAAEGSREAQAEYLKSQGIEPTVVEKPAKAKKGAIAFDALKKWGELKKEVIAVMGNADLYYTTLGVYNYKHSNEIQSKEDATAIWKLIGAGLNKAKQDNELLKTLQEAGAVLGAETFDTICNGMGIDEIMALDSDALAFLLENLKATADARKSKS